MKFTLLQQDLLPVLQSVARSVGTRSTLPVLDNILLSAEGKNLKVAATNLEIGVIKNINAEIEEEGAVTIPAKTIVDIISALGQTQVRLESEGENLTIISGKFKASINGIPSSEFPAIPLAKSSGISFSKEAFLSSAAILFASAIDEGRPVLTGILTQITDSKLDFVATDGFRLAHRRVELPKNAAPFKSLIPKKTFEEVLRIISEQDALDVSIAASENQNQAVFTIGGTIVSSRLIEGNFPVWERIIPIQIVGKAIVEKEVFLQAIKLAAVFAKNEANIVVLTTQKGLLKLQSHAKELGNQENEIEGEIEGEDLKIAFNTKFLLDAVSNIPTSQVLMEFSGALSASIVKPVGIEGLQFIVMPVRLS